MAVALAPVAQLDRASVYGTEGQRFESSRARLEPRRKRRVVAAVRAGALDGDVVERGAVPVAQVGGRLVGGLQELQQAGVRVRGRADRLVGQQELAERRCCRTRLGGLTGAVAEAVGLGVGVGVEGALLAAAGPEAAAATARGSSPRPSPSRRSWARRRDARGAGRPENRVTAMSKAPQKKCTGLTLPRKRARKRRQHAVGLDELTPEQLRGAGS